MTSLWISLLITSVMFNFDSVLSDGEESGVGKGDRIFNGTLAIEGEFKFMVYVKTTKHNATSNATMGGTGSLLSPSYVMTSTSYYVRLYTQAMRNCNSSSQLEYGLKFNIHAGYLKSRDKEEQLRTATEKDIFVHPSVWLKVAERGLCEKHQDDSCFELINEERVMIINVPDPFKLVENVATIAILKESLPFEVRLDDGLIVGYGYFNDTKEGIVNFPTLRKGSGIIGGEKLCRREQPGIKSKGWVCFKGVGTSACGGDPGGLIMYRHKHVTVAIGVIVNMPCTADGITPGVATASIVAWIRYVTKNSTEVKYAEWYDIKPACVLDNREGKEASPDRAGVDVTHGHVEHEDHTGTEGPTTKKSAGSRLVASVVDIVAMTLFFLY